MIVKFSDWQGASLIRHDAYLFVEWGEVDGHMGGSGCTLHCFSALIIVHLCCIWDALHV